MKYNETTFVISLFSIIAIFLCCYVLLLPPYSIEPGDSINHYLYAKHAFAHPENFLDLWAKPLFVLFASPFALFGLKGVYVFNIVCTLTTAFILYKCCKILQISDGWLVLLLIVFTPLYFALIPTSLTEILFATILTFILYLLLAKKFYWAAILASFIPFARQEGYLLLPILLVLFVLCKQYKAIPFLLVGLVVYCLCTFVVFNDALRFIHRHPYNPGESIYGSGQLFHYFIQRNNIWGEAYFTVFLFSLFIVIFVTVKKLFIDKIDYQNQIIILIVVIGFPMAFFFIHTYIWWKGISGSAGLIRVMTVIIPFTSLILVYGLSVIKEYIITKKYMYAGFILVFVYLMVSQNVKPLYKNLTMPQTVLIDEGLKKMNDENIQVATIFCLDPYIPFATNRDAFDPKFIKQGWELNHEWPHISMKKNDVLIWESHFCYPSVTPIKDSLLLNDSLQTLYHRIITEPTDTNRKYEVFIVQKR